MTFLFKNIDYKDRVFKDFEVRMDGLAGPGWYVFGRNSDYGGHLVMLCARPDVKARRHPHYNNAVQRGWRTKREAQAAADVLNKQHS